MLRFPAIIFMISAYLQGSAVPIRESLAVDIGGIKQWISISGADDKSPVLLFLHGGPGNSVMGYAESFTSELQKHFVVVQWDQRESGKTATLNESDRPLTVALMEEDATEVTRYLRNRFSKDKIYVMGHSWGGFLGLRLAARHPEMLMAYMAVSPMVDQLESERLSLEWMINKATKENNSVALKELHEVKIPFQNGEQLYYHRGWLSRLTGNSKFPTKEFVTTWAEKWLLLFNEASAVNFFVTTPELKCPVYFFVGRLDYQTHYTLTERYFNAVKANQKRLFWFEKSGHSPNTKEPTKFQDIVIHTILPETEN